MRNIRNGKRTMIRLISFVFLAVVLSMPTVPHKGLLARVLHDPEETIKESFPGSVISKIRIYLTGTESDELREVSGAKLHSRMITFYVAKDKNQKIVGLGAFDTHTVRTKEQTLWIALSPEGEVKLVRQISFYEPPDYMLPERWFSLFAGKSGENTLRPGVDIAAVTGATLSVNASSSAVRKILYFYKAARAKNKLH